MMPNSSCGLFLRANLFGRHLCILPTTTTATEDNISPFHGAVFVV
jgi:hypothetical protein